MTDTIKPSDRRPEWYTVFAVYYATRAGPHGGGREPEVTPGFSITPIWATPAKAAAMAAGIADQAQRALATFDEREQEAPKPKRKR